MPDCPPTGMIPPDDESEAIQRHVEGFMVFHELAMAEPEVWGNAMPTLAHSLADRLTSAGQPVPEELRRWVEGEK